jgi:alanine dehydrogenase
MALIVLSEADVASVFSMADAIAAVESALKLQAAGAVNQPLRVGTRSPAGMFGAMPCAIAGVGIGAKLVTFFPGNAVLGTPTHNAIIALVDPDTGVPKAVMDGRYITEIRTAATSAVATRVLAKQDAGCVAMLGTGVQARAHVDALREIGKLEELRVWGRTARKVDELVEWARAKGIRTSAAVAGVDAGALSEIPDHRRHGRGSDERIGRDHRRYPRWSAAPKAGTRAPVRRAGRQRSRPPGAR